MSNVLFNRETKEVAGLNRPALPFEIEVTNVDVTNLTKVHEETVYVTEKNVDGKDLYILPITETQETGQIKVLTTETTNEPAMHEVTVREPLMQDGVQLSYETEGGQVIYCYHDVLKDERMYDEEGNKLYYRTEPEYSDVVVGEEKITDEDERWTPDLKPSLEQKTTSQYVTFSDKQEMFNYTDVIKHKESQILKDSLYVEAILFEQMDEDKFSTDLATFKANIGFDFISIPPEGQVRTEKIIFNNPHTTVGVKWETKAEGLKVFVGALADDLQPLDKFNERKFSEPVPSVYVLFKNNTGKTIDLNSFAILG